MSRLAQYRQAARENHTTKSTKYTKITKKIVLFRVFRGFVSFVATVAVEQRSVFAHGSTSSPRADVSRAPDMSLPALPQRDRQVTPGVGGLGIQRQRELKLIDGFVDPALHGQREPEADVRLDGIRHQPQRRAEMIDGVGGPAGLDEHARQIVLSLTIRGVELHRPAEVRDRLLTPARLKSSRSIIAGCRERGAEVPVRHGGVGIEPQRFAKLRNRLVELASGSERDAQRV